MDAEVNVDAAVKYYTSLRKAQKRYYEKNRDAILAKYREAHPNPRPRGRPKKVAPEGVAEGVKTDGI